MKILVLSLAGIGDTLLATPLIHELHLNFPGASIDAFVFWAGARDLLDGNPHLRRVHQLNLVKASNREALAYLGRLRKERYDLSLNAHPQSRLAYRVIARVIGAPERWSHIYDNSTWLDRLLVNRRIPQDYSRHGVENNLDFLRALGKRPLLPEHPLEVYLGAEEKAWAQNWLRDQQLEERRFFGIHVGSGGTKNLALKRWPLSSYIELIRQLARVAPETVLVLFGGSEEQEAHAQIRAQTNHPALFTPATRNFRQTAALLARCQGFLSVDTALMHLAAAMKVPRQIVIEAPTLNVTNVPQANPYRLVPNPAVHGRNLEFYRYDGGPIRGTAEDLRRCMEAVKVEDVLGAVCAEWQLNR